MSSPESSARYWRINRNLIAVGLLLGFAATFGVAYFARELSFAFLGWPFSFWVASQGALLLYLLIVAGYAWYMNRLDERLSGANPAPRA
jgi:putative solute:sodium symporter small subunit